MIPSSKASSNWERWCMNCALHELTDTFTLTFTVFGRRLSGAWTDHQRGGWKVFPHYPPYCATPFPVPCSCHLTCLPWFVALYMPVLFFISVSHCCYSLCCCRVRAVRRRHVQVMFSLLSRVSMSWSCFRFPPMAALSRATYVHFIFWTELLRVKALLKCQAVAAWQC